MSCATGLEVFRRPPRGGYRAALFDFDGTLSLIRRNWPGVMIPMMVEVLRQTGTSETHGVLTAHVEDYVMRLNGKQTIYQMMQLADEVRSRGGTPLEPLAYKHRYHELLGAEMAERVSALRSGQLAAEELTVPGSKELLTALGDRGIELYLASGTDVAFVREEARALELDGFFGSHIYGALDDYQNFSKAMVIDRLVNEGGIPAEQLMAFGDGYVEIQETRRVGGLAIGVASNEETRTGVNQWKRDRLVGAGADLIIGDYRCLDELLALLGI